jgi:hypothetical protein
VTSQTRTRTSSSNNPRSVVSLSSPTCPPSPNTRISNNCTRYSHLSRKRTLGAPTFGPLQKHRTKHPNLMAILRRSLAMESVFWCRIRSILRNHINFSLVSVRRIYRKKCMTGEMIRSSIRSSKINNDHN